MAVGAVAGEPVGVQRPAFSLEAPGAPAKPTLPAGAWAAAAASCGLSFGAFLAATYSNCYLLMIVNPCGRADTIAMLIAVLALVAAAVWWLLPTKRGELGPARAAGLLALAGGLLGILLVFYAWFSGEPFALASYAGVALIPAAMLPAARPDARIGSSKSAGAGAWITIGAIPAAAVIAGVGMGWALWDWIGWSSGSYAWTVQVPLLLAAALALGSGAAIVRSVGPLPKESAHRVTTPRRWLATTPMQRYALLAEVAIAAAAAGCASALFTPIWASPYVLDAAASVVLGAVLGSFAYLQFAPRLDSRRGRGFLLALAPLLAALGPPLMLVTDIGGRPSLLLLVAGIFAFVISSAPQRYALAFDLCPSKGRLRAALDLQGARTAAAAIGPFLLMFGNGAVPSLGSFLLSAFAIFAFALFASTLGGLGRRTL